MDTTAGSAPSGDVSTSGRRAETDRSLLRSDWLGRAALLVVLVVTVLSVVRAFGPMTYGSDIWRQSDTASIAHNFAVNGMNLFFPQIDWGGAGPGYVEAEFQLMPWLTALSYLVFGEHASLGRLISLAFMLVGVAAFWGVARRLLSPGAARWSLIAFAVSPAFMRYATAFMPEATVLAFYLLAIYAFCRWLEEDRWVWLAATAAAASVAGLVKPTSLHLGVVLLAWLVIVARNRLRRPSVYLAAVLALVAPALWLWHAHGLYTTYGNTFGVISGGDDKFGNLGYWLSPGFYVGNLRIEAVWTLGVVGVPLAALGAVVAYRRRGPVMLLAGFAGLVIYYFAVARYSESAMGIQYHVFSLPYGAVLTGMGLRAVDEWLPDRIAGRLRGTLAALVTVALFGYSATVWTGSLRDESGAFGVCARALDALSTPADLVVVSTTSSSVEDGVANNWQEPVIFYLADRRGWSLAADQHVPSVLASDQAAGAKFFVVDDADLLPASGALAAWLGENATQRRSSAADGCGIWELRSR